MLRFVRRALAPVLLLLIVALTAGWRFHATLVKALPAVDTTVTAPPAELTLWFNERPDLALSNVRLRGPDSSLVATTAPVAATDSMALVTTVRGTLAPGEYTVLWRTAGPDGHVMRGRYTFTYRP